MPASAPRYDPRILSVARKLDDRRQPMAETCRRVGDAASRLGLPRPSYVHLRRFLRAERERRLELQEIAEEIVADLMSGRAPKLLSALERAQEAAARAELRRRS
jgi:hypothetical protein